MKVLAAGRSGRIPESYPSRRASPPLPERRPGARARRDGIRCTRGCGETEDAAYDPEVSTRGGEPEDDAELVRRHLGGDASAWRTITERYIDLVYALARASGAPAAEAEDVTQEVFLALFESLPSLRDPARLGAWLVKTTRRRAWAARRRARGRRDRERTVARPDESPRGDPTVRLDRVELRQCVRRAYAALGARCRDLLDLLFLADSQPRYQDVAARLGLAPSGIGPMRARCLAQLEDELRRLGYPFDGFARSA
jgi:RNA polymerase sigma factor (sigma-70 family)